MTNRREAETAFTELADDETHRCLTAARRFHQWHIEDSAARGVTPESQLEFRTGLGKWIRTGTWVQALSVPLKSDPIASEGLAVVDEDDEDFAAITRLRGGKRPFVGASGKITVFATELAQARKELAH